MSPGVPTERVTIGRLLDSGIRLSWRESLAITQAIAALRAADARGTTPTDFLSGFALEPGGGVTAVAEECPAVSVSELALFLAHLLPGDAAPLGRRAPAAVHLAIGRALELVEAPPFASLAEFSDALARREDRSRVALLRGVYERCVARLTPAREPLGVSEHRAALPVSAPTEEVEKDRRTSGPRVDALRRMMRERDHHDYLVRAERVAKRSRMSDRERDRTRGPSVDAVRRWLREADREHFELLSKPAGRRPSWLPLAGLALAVFAVAAVGLGQRQPSGGGLRAPAPAARRAAPSMTARESAAGPAGATSRLSGLPDLVGPRPEDPQARRLQDAGTPAEQPVGDAENRAGSFSSRRDSGTMTGPGEGADQAAQGLARFSAETAASRQQALASAASHRNPTGASQVARRARVTGKRALALAPATRAQATRQARGLVVVGGAPASEAAFMVKRRPAPLRLFAAIGRRLSAVFHGT